MFLITTLSMPTINISYQAANSFRDQADMRRLSPAREEEGRDAVPYEGIGLSGRVMQSVLLPMSPEGQYGHALQVRGVGFRSRL